MNQNESNKIHSLFVEGVNLRAEAEATDIGLWYQLLLNTPDDFLLEGELEIKQILRQFH